MAGQAHQGTDGRRATAWWLLVVALLAPTGCRSGSDRELEAAGADREEISLGEVLATTSAPPLGLPTGDAEHWSDLERLYQQLGERPLWLEGRKPRPDAEVLLHHLQEAASEGLEPAEYGAPQLTEAMAGLDRRTPDRRLHELDLALSYAALRFGAHLLHGRVRPEQVDVRWRIPGRQLDLVEHFADALAAEGDFATALARLRPPHPQYRMLVAHRDHYREIVDRGGWSHVPEGAVLGPGDSGDADRLRRLVRRLAIEGFLEERVALVAAPGGGGGAGQLAYSEELAEAVSRFQRTRTLAVDGRLGPETQKELNVPADERLGQIELNLERWRWMPQELGSPAVVVNIPGYTLEVWEDGLPVMAMNVAVGEEGWPTPIFADEIQYLVLNPDWNVPENIVQATVLPKVRSDPHYLRNNDMEVLRGWTPDAPRVDDSLVFSIGEVPGLRLRQRPGRQNPLGRIKFMFPNEYDVYLHDTPAVAQLQQPERTLSHGCVRLERPYDLALYLLAPDRWDRGRLMAAIDSGQMRDVGLSRKVPVYLAYFTAMVRDDGQIEFYRDPYEIDRQQVEAQRQALPNAAPQV
jgi:L,D-transpeptidase YcbB